MAQQLQFFTLQGCQNIFDPMIRKKLFNISNQIYTGKQILPRFDKNYKKWMLQDVFDTENNPFQ